METELNIKKKESVNMVENYKYVCVMFPYPSGSGLHAGHWYNYAIIDSYCRYLRLKGENVFQPFGYDAFGLPAENYAKKIGGDAREVTYKNINNFRKQVQSMNTNYEELLITSDKQYQELSKFIFKELYKRGLAYKKKGFVNYDPIDKTVLANEQVIDGIADKSGAKVERVEMNQWYFKITDYKDRLIRNLDNIDYPQSTINAQKNWLENLEDWCISRQRSWGCPIPIEGENDTMDTFVDSSFYFIIYPLLKGLKPKQVDLYVGGREHACMHLIYARFITMFLYDIGFINFEEPFKKVVHQGMILNNGEKMSKSKGNVVNLDNYNSDVIRFYLMFIGHYFDGGTWSDKNIKGVERFISKWHNWLSVKGDDNINYSEFEYQIFKYTEAFKFNKVVSSFMTLLKNNKTKKLNKATTDKLYDLLELYMPNIKKGRL